MLKSSGTNFVFLLIIISVVLLAVRIRRRKKKVKEEFISNDEEVEVDIPESNAYVLTIMEGEGERRISIMAENVMEALMKFAVGYKDACKEWRYLSIDIEQVESIE